MIGLWREKICNFDQLCSTLQAICTPPRHTTPMGFPSFPSAKSKQTSTKQTNTKICDHTDSMCDRPFPPVVMNKVILDVGEVLGYSRGGWMVMERVQYHYFRETYSAVMVVSGAAAVVSRRSANAIPT
jgi:hypothetical protein